MLFETRFVCEYRELMIVGHSQHDPRRSVDLKLDDGDEL